MPGNATYRGSRVGLVAQAASPRCDPARIGRRGDGFWHPLRGSLLRPPSCAGGHHALVRGGHLAVPGGRAGAALILGLAFYLVTVARFAPRELLTGHGDQWVAGGALAISALACVKIIQAGDALGRLTSLHDFLTVVALVLWCLAMLWLGPLIAAEALRPRLSYDVRRWATVFPLGMYAASSFALSQVTGITWISAFARVWTWLAITVSVFVLAGLIRRSWQVLSG
jgi:tellurite resistance protein TehA-like permease